MNRALVALCAWFLACASPTSVATNDSLSDAHAGAPGAAGPTDASKPPREAREINFPDDMNAWGYLDVTKGGASVVTEDAAGCPDAVPNMPSAATITTRAIQCRLDALGVSPNSGALYFPVGDYYIDATLSLTSGHWTRAGDGTDVYAPWGAGPRLQAWHILGRDPATTRIIWAGSCDRDPNIADPAHVTKYRDLFYVSGMSPLSVERLTLDGANCAGSGIEMVSSPRNMTGVQLNELVIENLTEVGIVGDRNVLTKDEARVGDTSGMVSEVSITNTVLRHIGYAGILIGAANALDYWVRDSGFDDCGIGVTNSSFGYGSVPGLAWGNSAHGNFSISNSVFKGSHAADALTVDGGLIALRNNVSTGAGGPFFAAVGLHAAAFVQGNVVAPSPGVLAVAATATINFLTLLQNTFLTGETPAVLAWTNQYGGYPLQLPGASPVIGAAFNQTFSNVTSIGNRYSATAPFSTARQSLIDQQKYTLGTAPGALLDPTKTIQCAVSHDAPALIGGRTFCNYPGGASAEAAYNLYRLDDVAGVTDAPPPLTPAPFVRPEIKRPFVVPALVHDNTAAAGFANADSIQRAIDRLAAMQAECDVDADDVACPARWGVVFLPAGTFLVSKTVHVPASIRLRLTGTYTSQLNWYWYGGDRAGNPPGATPIFRFAAPAHVVLSDVELDGSNDNNFPDPLGEGIVCDVSDLATSRVLTDALSLGGSFSVQGLGNARFEMRGFQNGAAGTIRGSGPSGAGSFGWFGGNPSNLTVGGGARLMIQDTWYEGSSSRYVTCANDAADVTIENSQLSMGGWHGTPPDALTTFNMDTCASRLAVIASSVNRDGFSGKAPTESLILSAAASARTQVLFLQTDSMNSNFGNGQDTLPIDFLGTLDQGYLRFDAASHARYANVQGTHQQHYLRTGGGDWAPYLAATEAGEVDASFIQTMLASALDPRLRAAATIVPEVASGAATDIQIYRVRMRGTRMDAQFLTPGAIAE